MNTFSSVKGQSGVVLIVALIMLTMVTLIAVSSFNLTKTNLQIAQNMEARAVTKSYAQIAIDELVSNEGFWASGGLTKSYDDLLGGVVVSVGEPKCMWAIPDDHSQDECVNSEPGFCKMVTWDLRAESKDLAAGSVSIIRQGIAKSHLVAAAVRNKKLADCLR